MDTNALILYGKMVILDLSDITRRNDNKFKLVIYLEINISGGDDDKKVLLP